MTMKNNLNAIITNATSINNRKRILIDEFISSTDERIKEFHLDDHAIEAIFDCLEHPERDLELFKSIIKRLYEIYRGQDRQLRLMTLIFVPTLVAIYLRNHHQHSCRWDLNDVKKTSPSMFNENNDSDVNASIAVLLICVYNFEIINQNTGDLKTIDVRLVSLAKPSIYHEPNAHTTIQSSTIPTEQMLAKMNNNETRITIFGPYQEVEQLNTGNQQSVFTVLMKVYNQHIQEVGYYSLQSMCRLYLELLKQGSQIGDLKQCIRKMLQNSNSDADDDDTVFGDAIKPSCLQVHFTSEFLTELLRSAYFCYYNDLEDLSMDLIDEIAKRATYKFYADVILMVNAFKNTQAIINRDRENHVAKMKKMNKSQISLNATPPVSTVTVQSRKAAITNASFKTRKLPDDIPIVTTTVTQTAQTPGITVNAQAGGNLLTTGSNAKISSKRGVIVQHSKQNGRPIAFNKSLDSIHEESSPTNQQQSANLGKNPAPDGKQNKTSANHLSAKSARKGVIHMLKELKDKPKKSSKTNLNVGENLSANGKISANAQNNGNNGKIGEEMIPLRYMKSSSIDYTANDNDNCVPLAKIERFDNDKSLDALDDDEYDVAKESEDDDDDDDDDEIVSTNDEDDDPINECTKLRIDKSDMSDTSSGASSRIALLSNTNPNNNNNNNSSSQHQTSNLPQVIISDSKYSTATANT